MCRCTGVPVLGVQDAEKTRAAEQVEMERRLQQVAEEHAAALARLAADRDKKQVRAADDALRRRDE
jgi:hypothetical protein